MNPKQEVNPCTTSNSSSTSSDRSATGGGDNTATSTEGVTVPIRTRHGDDLAAAAGGLRAAERAA